MAVSAEHERIVAAAIREVAHIATLPEITVRIIRLVDDPTSTAQDLHRLISHDPALCSRILKVVNSSFYGLPGQIGSINRAIVMLGLNAVKNIAIAASLQKLFRGGRLTPRFCARDLWEHSIHVAITAKLVSDRLGYGLSDEAFLAGLIHDIGIIVEIQYDRNRFIEVLEGVEPDDHGVPRVEMVEVERRLLGASHEDFGAGLCRAWKFPSSLGLVTGHHHNPLALPSETRTLPALVHVADRLAAEASPTGFRLDLPSLQVSPSILAAAGIDADGLEQVRAILPEHLEEAAKDFI